MAKNRNTAAKRSREADKRRKALDKIERRKQRKETEPSPVPYGDSADIPARPDADSAEASLERSPAVP